MCESLRAYVKGRDEARNYFVNDASMVKTLECGCEYCELACKMVGEAGNVGKNKRLESGRIG